MTRISLKRLAPCGSNRSSWGLAQEWEVAPLEALRRQVPFLAGLRFSTEWAGELFPLEFVQAKIEEAEQLLRLLESEPASVAETSARH